MEEALIFLKKWGILIIILLLVWGNFKSCTTSVKLKKLDQKVVVFDSTLNAINIPEIPNIITEKEVKDIMQLVMVDFLIFEQELDRKEITIFEIKEIIEND